MEHTLPRVFRPGKKIGKDGSFADVPGSNGPQLSNMLSSVVTVLDEAIEILGRQKLRTHIMVVHLIITRRRL